MTSPVDGIVDLALRRGLVTSEQVDDARTVRAQMEAMGLRPRSLVEVLVEKGHLDAETLEGLQREEHTVEGRETIAGFQLLELLGRGSMGAVYKARQVSLDRIVALKVLDPALAHDAAYVGRFLAEARAVARLSHTNLVSGIDVGDDAGIRYLAMEYADGVTLARVLRRGGALDEERALLLGLQLARALEYAHKNGLVHGDVRPENVIVTADGVAKLCDLGVARRVTKATDEGHELGTSPDYLSPEQARGVTTLAPASDLYAVGCVLFHLLTGRVPFPAANREAAVARHLTEPASDVRELAPEVSEEAAKLVARLLAKPPSARPASASEVVLQLDDALQRLRTSRARPTAPAPYRPGAASGGPSAPTLHRRRRR